MKQLKLDRDTWDWDLSSGSLVFITGTERAAQANRQALQTFLKEYFLNTAYGIPYFEYVFVKNPDYDRIGAEFQSAILRDPIVNELTSLSLETDGSRIGLVHYSATTTEGETVENIVEVTI